MNQEGLDDGEDSGVTEFRQLLIAARAVSERTKTARKDQYEQTMHPSRIYLEIRSHLRATVLLRMFLENCLKLGGPLLVARVAKTPITAGWWDLVPGRCGTPGRAVRRQTRPASHLRRRRSRVGQRGSVPLRR
jgi:hypothetical protein